MKAGFLNRIANSFFFIVTPFATRLEIYLVKNKNKKLTARFKNFGSNSVLGFPNYISKPQYISIGKNFSSLWNLRLEPLDNFEGQVFQPEIIIGDNVCVNSDVHIGCISKVVIGNNVLMASRIYISDHSHGEISKEAIGLTPFKRPLVSKGPVFIEDNVWIGEGVCILPGVTVGKNAIIGANAVVTKDIPPNSVVAGIPAKVIRNLSEL